MQDYLSIIEYARFYNVSDMTIRRRIKTGRLQAVLKEGKYYIPLDSKGEGQSQSRVAEATPSSSSHVPLSMGAARSLGAAKVVPLEVHSPIQRELLYPESRDRELPREAWSHGAHAGALRSETIRSQLQAQAKEEPSPAAKAVTEELLQLTATSQEILARYKQELDSLVGLKVDLNRKFELEKGALLSKIERLEEDNLAKTKENMRLKEEMLDLNLLIQFLEQERL